MNKLFIFFYILTITGCATKPLDLSHLENAKDTAELEVYLSNAKNRTENLYLRGAVVCDTGILTKLRGKKTVEKNPILLALPAGGEYGTPTKIKLPANKPIGLKWLRNHVGDQHFTDFVVMLEANKIYEIHNYKDIEVFEKDSKQKVFFLPHDFLHQQLKCD